jgi:hypothetical protein
MEIKRELFRLPGEKRYIISAVLASAGFMGNVKNERLHTKMA